MRIHTGDIVLITSGKDKGKTGQVLRVLHGKNRVVVAGINMRTKHIRKTPQRAGQIIRYEAGISACNVMMLDPKTKKPTRVGFRFEGEKKVRVAKVSGEVLEQRRVKKEEVREKKEVKEGKESKDVLPTMPVKKPFWQRLGFGAEIQEEEAHEKARDQADRTIPDQGQGATTRAYQRGG